MLAQMVKQFLEDHEFTVTHVANGADGFRLLLEANAFDVILSDILMPSFPGGLFYRAIQALSPQVSKRLIFITGFGGHPEVEKLRRQSQVPILDKPFQLDDLLETVRSAISTEPVVG